MNKNIVDCSELVSEIVSDNDRNEINKRLQELERYKDTGFSPEQLKCFDFVNSNIIDANKLVPRYLDEIGEFYTQEDIKKARNVTVSPIWLAEWATTSNNKYYCCGCHNDSINNIRTKYCPHCGALMTGVIDWMTGDEVDPTTGDVINNE